MLREERSESFCRQGSSTAAAAELEEARTAGCTEGWEGDIGEGIGEVEEEGIGDSEGDTGEVEEDIEDWEVDTGDWEEEDTGDLEEEEDIED